MLARAVVAAAPASSPCWDPAVHESYKASRERWEAETEPFAPWRMGREVLVQGHCRRCRSTLARLPFPGEVIR